jgi:hypothetical protein
MASDANGLYAELKGDLQALSSALFQFAEQQVRKRGAFLPFAAGLTKDGQVSLHAASPGKDFASSPEVLPLLHEGLRSAVAEQDLAAVGVCEWVKITPEDGKQTDAVKVLVEHSRGLSVAFYVSCRRKLFLGWQFDAMLVQPAAPEVKPLWKQDAAQQ